MQLTVYKNCHWLPRFERCFELFLILIDSDLDVATAPLKAESNAAPMRRKPRIDGYAVTAQRDPCKTKYRHQPDAAQSRNVHAAINRRRGIREIYGRGPLKIA